MRHARSKHQLNRFTSWRKATVTSMARNVLLHQSINTTKLKAKATQGLVEDLVSLGKDDSLIARRRAFKILGEHSLVNLLFNDIAPRFSKRNSGYTRILSLSTRRGDGAQLVIFELTEQKKELKKPKKEKPETAVAPEEKKKVEKEKEKPRIATAVEEEKRKKPTIKKPTKGFLKGIRQIFKKERDSL